MCGDSSFLNFHQTLATIYMNQLRNNIQAYYGLLHHAPYHKHDRYVLCHFLEQMGFVEYSMKTPQWECKDNVGCGAWNFWNWIASSFFWISPWSWPGATSMRRGSRCYGSDNESLPGVVWRFQVFFWSVLCLSFSQQNWTKAWHFFFFLRRTWQCILKLLDFVCRRIRSPKSSAIPMTSLDLYSTGFPLQKSDLQNSGRILQFAMNSRGFG